MNRKKHIVTTLSMIPGVGHIILGLHLKGVFFFGLFAFFVNMAVVSKYIVILKSQQSSFNGAIAASAIIWVYSFSEVFRVNYIITGMKKQGERKNLIKKCCIEYARQDFSSVLKIAKQLIKNDKYELEGRLLAGKAYFGLGKYRKAKRLFKYVAALDVEKNWNKEITHYLDLMKGEK